VTDALKKKGLRHSASLAATAALAGDRCPEEEGIKTRVEYVPSQEAAGDRCPEEEGIKTAEFASAAAFFCLVTDALKKKGLRRLLPGFFAGTATGDRCPEEEGIKTTGTVQKRCVRALVTDALKKKGLRPTQGVSLAQLRRW